ncbi:CD3072 family TudS-related putative desulfidase [Absicoccus intestinalis]|uniref:DUF523 domain-containing protein n=1 Tax=Absicoccus intestinalis TaxID=2926319 RepID=A0ABU4WNG9_9FIRM|nr:CD3072 family TudS-related putative desulfidase [Absicoccus sp. CLA-KB-P134]MDX8418117.1 hypothetical protein [Absicoccus sp. CLA-KB-P134]
MKKILFVSHCILNTASKVVMDDRVSLRQEEEVRLSFLKKALEQGVQFIQLPCPEFTLYGCKRWGHVSNQFDNPFFRKHCQELLYPYILQAKEYLNDKRKYQVLGFVGIDGSPSCGVKYTCSGQWGGSYQDGNTWAKKVSTVKLVKKEGIYMQALKQLLKEEDLSLPVIGLYAPEKERLFALLDE